MWLNKCQAGVQEHSSVCNFSCSSCLEGRHICNLCLTLPMQAAGPCAPSSSKQRLGRAKSWFWSQAEMLWFALEKPKEQSWTWVAPARNFIRNWTGPEQHQVCRTQEWYLSHGMVLKSPQTFWSAPEPFSLLKPAPLTLHRQQHWALDHTTKVISSKMGRASGLLSIKSRKLQITF